MWITITWIIVSIIIASYGEKRKIGFMLALLVSLVFSPLIGIICVALSERKSNDNGRNNSSEKTNKGFDIEQFRKN